MLICLMCLLILNVVVLLSIYIKKKIGVKSLSIFFFSIADKSNFILSHLSLFLKVHSF